MPLNYQTTRFLTSAAAAKQFPTNQLPEVAFVGRSNVGKSSLINLLTNQKTLAKTSKTPGRTQLVNFFITEDRACLVDLPGYGFADVPEAVQSQWNGLMGDYLTKRENILGLLILLDVRRTPSEHDRAMIDMVNEHQIPFLIVLTKCDKMSKNELFNARQKISKAIQVLPKQLIATSASSRLGLDELRQNLDALFDDYFAVKEQIDVAVAPKPV